MKIRPKAITKKLAQRINTGTFIKKYGEKTAASVLGLSIGTLASTTIRGNTTGTIHGAAIIGASTGAGLFYLSQVLPKKLIKEPMIKLMGKPRLAAEVSKNIKEPFAKSMMYLIANARTIQEKQELTRLIIGEASQDNGATILRIAKRASVQQNDSLAKTMYVQLRGQRGIPSRLLEPRISRTLKALWDKKITNDAEYTNEIAKNALPFAITHTMDMYGITNREARTKIFEALKKQIERTIQKHKFGADVTPQALMQDMQIIKYGEEFAQALKEATPDTKIQNQAFRSIVSDMQQLMTYMHGRISTELFMENLFQRMTRRN